MDREEHFHVKKNLSATLSNLGCNKVKCTDLPDYKSQHNQSGIHIIIEINLSFIENIILISTKVTYYLYVTCMLFSTAQSCTNYIC